MLFFATARDACIYPVHNLRPPSKDRPIAPPVLACHRGAGPRQHRCYASEPAELQYHGVIGVLKVVGPHLMNYLLVQRGDGSWFVQIIVLRSYTNKMKFLLY